MPINPVWRLDPAQTIVALEGFAPELSSAAQDATLFVENGRVQVRPASAGRALDVPATVALFVEDGAAIVLNGQLPLQVKPVPPAVIDVGAALAAAESLLQNNIAVTAYDPIRDEAFTWVVSPAVWGAWLQLQAGPTAAEFSWALDEAAAAGFFAARNSALGEDRYLDVEHAVAQTKEAIQSGSSTVELRVFHTAVTHVVQAGETLAGIGRGYGIPYPWIQQVNPGLLDGLGVGQQITIPSPDDLLPYPIVNDKRIVVSIGQQRVRVYEAGGLKWEWAASTGISSSPTAPGVFQVQTHEPNAYAANWDLWMPNFMGIYQPVPTSDFMNGFHGFPTRDGANLLWTNNLGAPVTYGCILLGNQQAEQLYSWAEQGVVVEIQP
jgi:lipoprotein-anchoring transpeptidase ErfK/SrfK